MTLAVVADVSGMWQESTQAVASGISGMGADTLGDSVQRAADALDIFSGLAQIGAIAATLIMADTAKETAEAGAKTAIAAANPLTWGNIALALAAAGVGAACVYAYAKHREHRLSANLSNPSEALALAQTVGVLA